MKFNKTTIIQTVKGLLWPTAAAALITGVLLAATLVQTKIHAPVVNSDFSNLYRLIEKNPSDQNLIDEARALDLLARKAYFTSQYQLRVGTVIFFAALALFLILWNVQAFLDPPPPVQPGKKISWWEQQTRSAKTAAVTSAAIAVAAISYGIFHKYELTAAVNSKRGALLSHERYAQWWMNFRGPDGIGVAAYANAPLKFDGGSMAGVRWKVETPLEGNSSPVVYDDKIFLTGGTKENRQVFCFSVDDGKLLWARGVKAAGSEGLPAPKVDRETGYAAPTPACDGKNVYAVFANGDIAAFTLKGKPVWSRFLGTPDNHYGHSSSLIAYNGIVFAQMDQYDTGKLFALDGKTGKTVWEAPRTVLSWGSPILVNAGGRRELILVDNENAASYDPGTGKPLWSLDCLYGEVGPSAAFASGMAFTANEYATAVAIDLNSMDANGKPAKRWEWRGDLPNTSSPVSADSLLFLATSSGVVTCVDNREGKTLWTREFDNGFYSSPVIAGNKVLLFDRKGVMYAFALSAEFSQIAASPIGEPVVTTPAVLDGYMIVRGEKYLYRIDGVR